MGFGDFGRAVRGIIFLVSPRNNIGQAAESGLGQGPRLCRPFNFGRDMRAHEGITGAGHAGDGKRGAVLG